MRLEAAAKKKKTMRQRKKKWRQTLSALLRLLLRPHSSEEEKAGGHAHQGHTHKGSGAGTLSQEACEARVQVWGKVLSEEQGTQGTVSSSMGEWGGSGEGGARGRGEVG